MTLRKKLLITIACLSCILCILVTGTVAWLIAESDPIVNTFLPSVVSVKLTETGAVLDGTTQTQICKMIPGTTLPKDPKVTVTNDIDCYVFVEVEETNNTWGDEKVVTYTMGTDWLELMDASGNAVPGVYYRKVEADAAEKTFAVIADNKVTINSALTEEYMSGLTEASMYPSLSFTAYACQKEGFTDAAEAWEEIKPSTP